MSKGIQDKYKFLHNFTDFNRLFGCLKSLKKPKKKENFSLVLKLQNCFFNIKYCLTSIKHSRVMIHQLKGKFIHRRDLLYNKFSIEIIGTDKIQFHLDSKNTCETVHEKRNKMKKEIWTSINKKCCQTLCHVSKE